MGDRASQYSSGPDREPTCKANNSQHRTRRDYFMVSPDTLPLINDFQVLRLTGLPVHYALSVTFKNVVDNSSPPWTNCASRSP